jgi:Domain of unknown function (DUF2470)
MQPTHAEVARTLAAGHLPARAHIAGRRGPFPLRHVTDAHGRVLLLSPRDGVLAGARRTTEDADETPLVLDIADVPPIAGAPSRGRVWVAGWATLLMGDEARRGALDYADMDGDGDLLDVGDTLVLHRMHVAELRYEHDGALFDVDPDKYAQASPDPLRTIEFDLIADLTEHHAAEITAYVRRGLGPLAHPPEAPEVVRLDRYGLLVRIGNRLARVAFPRAVKDRHDLAHLLHPVLCHRCGGATASSAGDGR